jgi:hypothetical protein
MAVRKDGRAAAKEGSERKKEGRKKGRKEGRKAGRKDGRTEGREETACSVSSRPSSEAAMLVVCPSFLPSLSCPLPKIDLAAHFLPRRQFSGISTKQNLHFLWNDFISA